MATLFVLEQGAKIGKTSKRIIIEKDGNNILEVPEFKVEKVFIFGNVQISTQALRFFLENGQDVSFFTMRGKFLGKLIGYSSKNIILRMKQYELYKKEDKRVQFARIFVKSKLKNCRTVLQKFLRNNREIQLSEEISRIEDLISSVDRKNAIGSLLGVEGMGSKLYFKGFAKMIKNDEFSFHCRNRRPPKDPVNSMLSFGYALLTSEMFSVLSALGFDPYLGIFHSIEYSRPSLALDLIEELRPAVIDRFALDIINKRAIGIGGFEEVKKEEEDVVKLFLSKDARSVFFKHYEARMQSNVTYLCETVTYRVLLERKARSFINALNEDGEIEPFIIK